VTAYSSEDTVGEKGLRAITIFAELENQNFNSTIKTIVIPRPTLDLQPFKGLITTWFHNGLTGEDIAEKLTDE
jgi:hypothetical protein